MTDLTRGSEGKSIFYFAMPMLIGSLFQQFYNTADSIIVGRFIGKDAMAAVSGANPIMFLLVSLLSGVSLGFSILVSQYYGANDVKKVKSTIDTTFIFVFGASVIITVIGILFSGNILRLMNTPSNILNQSRIYLVVIFSGTLFSAGYNSIAAILRGLGDSKTPLFFLIIATILNIVLDIIFIIYLKMNVEGVALATIIAQGSAFIFSLFYLNHKHEILKVKFRSVKLEKNIFTIGLKLGIPTGIQQVLFSVGGVALQSLVNGYGTSAMAAFGASGKIETFITLPIMNLGAAVSTFVAQNMGAGETERVKKGVVASVKISFIISCFVIILFLLFSKELVSLFNKDTEVVKIGSSYLKIVGPFFIFIATSFMISSAIRGAGDSIFAMISSIILLWVVRIPCSYMFSKLFGINGVWMGIPAGWFIGAIVTYCYYKSDIWKKKALVNTRLDELN